MVHLLKAQNLMMKNLVHLSKEEILDTKGKESKREMIAGKEEETEEDLGAWKEEDLEAEMIRGIEEEEIAARKIIGGGKGEILVKMKKDQEKEETPAEITDVRGRLT